MFQHSSDLRQEGAPAGVRPGDVLWMTPERGWANALRPEALVLRIVLVGFVVWCVYLLELDELQSGLLDAALGIAIWQVLASRPDIEELVLMTAASSDFFVRAYATGGGREIAIGPRSGLVLRIVPASGTRRLSESDGLVFRIVLLGVAVWFIHQLDLNGLLTGLLDAVLGIVAWDMLTSRREVDKVILMSVTRSDISIHADPPRVRNELAALFAAVVAIVVVIGRMSVMSLADKLARRRAFLRRMDQRDTSFRYSCDQFWLRIQGR